MYLNLNLNKYLIQNNLGTYLSKIIRNYLIYIYLIGICILLKSELFGFINNEK